MIEEDHPKGQDFESAQEHSDLHSQMENTDNSAPGTLSPERKKALRERIIKGIEEEFGKFVENTPPSLHDE